MARRGVSVRLDEDLIAWADEYGRAMRWDRSTVIVAALEQLRDDAGRGVPDAPAPGAAKPERASFESGEAWQNAVRLWRMRQG